MMKRCFVVLASAILLAGCGPDSQAPSTSVAPATSTVLYEVEGDTTAADITIRTPSGISQKSISVPLRNEKTGEQGLTAQAAPGSQVYISAQNSSDSSAGPVICRITVNGRVVSENSGSGSYAIATCNATA